MAQAVQKSLLLSPHGIVGVPLAKDLTKDLLGRQRKIESSFSSSFLLSPPLQQQRPRPRRRQKLLLFPKGGKKGRGRKNCDGGRRKELKGGIGNWPEIDSNVNLLFPRQGRRPQLNKELLTSPIYRAKKLSPTPPFLPLTEDRLPYPPQKDYTCSLMQKSATSALNFSKKFFFSEHVVN